MPRTLTKEKSYRDQFFDAIELAVTAPIEEQKTDKYSDSIWAEKPVTIEEFCDHFIGEPLFPIQAGYSEDVIGSNPMEWDNKYEGGLAFWGKGSGKDRTIAKLQLYVVYKLMCMKNPQKTLREKYNCSIGDNDAIDIGNMSINARQAKNVYFKKFKSVLKMGRNRATGKNWFEERGVDLRDGYDIQGEQVTFPHSITCHSLNGETNTGEGLNLFFVTIDEFGSFPADRAFDLLDSVRETVKSRFQKYGKVCIISYKYHHNDPMDVLYEKEKNDPSVVTSKASTWEVNIQRSKSDFQKLFTTNPEKAKMIYECKGGIETGGYITKKYMVDYMLNSNRYENPVIGDLVSVDAAHLGSLRFKEFFKGQIGRIYAAHVDLAKGKITDKGDAAGFALVHPEKFKPQIDEKFIAELAKEGIILDNAFLEIEKKGIMIDLALQLVAKDGAEVEFVEIRKFIQRLIKEFKFDIRYVTYDGYQSTESVQLLKHQGINSDILSVDKNNQAYDLAKELMYQQILKGYGHKIANREFKELILNDKGLVDHPEKSWDREIQEGIDKGSKDVSDCIAGASKNAYDNIPIESSVFFG